ncbi:MAG: hypothetical protein ACTHL8_17265 [Burkholderiaceae bacterium]
MATRSASSSGAAARTSGPAPGSQAHVDAGKRAQAREQRLRAGDVHHQQRRSAGGDAARDRHAPGAAARLQRDLAGVADQRTRGGVDEDDVGIQRDQAHRRGIGRGRGCSGRRRRRAARPRRGRRRPGRGGARRGIGHRQPVGRDPGGDQRVQAQELRGMRPAVGALHGQRNLDHRAGHRDARGQRDAPVQILGQGPVACPHAEVGRAAGGVDGRVELGERRRVDQLHRERERHAQPDRDDRRRLAPRVVQPLRTQQAAEEGGRGGKAGAFGTVRGIAAVGRAGRRAEGRR